MAIDVTPKPQLTPAALIAHKFSALLLAQMCFFLHAIGPTAGRSPTEPITTQHRRIQHHEQHSEHSRRRMTISNSSRSAGKDAAPPGHAQSFALARLGGSAVAGISELVIFHPVDTVAKRLMSHEGRVIVTDGGSLSATLHNLNQVVFRSAASKGVGAKYAALFPGIGFGAGYKVLQRVYKFGGQPFVKDLVDKRFGKSFQQWFGPMHAQTMASAVAGSLIGVGEIVLLPLDVLKIKAQTNPHVLRGRSVFNIFWSEGRHLYRGAGWTAARNAPGSFALFGGNAFVKDVVFKLKNHKEATTAQEFVASIAGATASITVAAPLDVIKTRIQSKDFRHKQSGFTILRKLLVEEGVTALFKGLTPKLVVVGPKLVFSMTVANQLIAHFEKLA